MPLFSRRPSLPAPIREQLALPPRDRVLVATELTGGGWAAATRRALYVVDPTVDRRPWADVDRATLDADTSVLTVHWVTGTSQELALTGSGAPAFAQVLRERVQSSVVHSEKVPVKGAGTVRVALRRDEDGELMSQVIGDGTVDLTDPTVAALVDAAERRVRAAAGLAG
ncbi:hypothetical protein [Cellulomonas cellasea]|uniref:Uncharacterized protein n=2 Tax=Cellulomonas cellasea TaxID=43670 RepID=A0A0A0BBP7_9CELL|nr:hypothetical protein [Cellulomonas cellasea]KGM03563.1 hypothetical protein Q760_01415 [Cellulomonas cellasea DSM 20118]GEA89208.1 hypothetical protein CCE01nite_31570 [Cellulomonas cellasea]